MNKTAKLQQRNKIILANALILAIVFLLYFFLISPSLAQIKQTDEKIATELQTLEKQEKILAAEKLNKQSLNEVENQVNKLSRYFISDNLAFITRIEALAALHELTVNLSMSPAESMGKFNKITLVINSVGDYKDQLEFIDDLEQLEFFFNIDSTDMTPNSSKTINMSLSANTYWINNDK